VNANAEIYLVTASIIDWAAIIELYKGFGVDSPIRRLDAKGILPKDPASLAVALDFNEGILELINLTYAVSLGIDEFLQFTNSSQLKKYVLLHKQYRVLALVSGSLADWRSAVVEGCQTDLRALWNTVYNSLRFTNFSRLFDSYTRTEDADGSFRLL